MNHASATPLDATTIDAAEIAKFSAIAAEWWDESGKFAPLHRINPVRLSYIRQHALRHFFPAQGAAHSVGFGAVAPFKK